MRVMDSVADGVSSVLPPSRSAWPWITVSRLLNSCAMPAARHPTASSFCAWRNCPSSFKRSVVSSTITSRHGPVSSVIGSAQTTVSRVAPSPRRSRHGRLRMRISGWPTPAGSDARSSQRRSSHPFSIYANNGNDLIPGSGVANGSGSNAFANLIGNPNAAPPITNSTSAGVLGPLLFNPGAFAAPEGLTFGDAGRNIVNIPLRWNLDMGLFKNFFVTERANFEFRAEGFNVFNHTQWSGINNGISCYGGSNYSAGDPSCYGQSFLHPSGAHNPRILQLGLKFIF